MHIWKRCVGQLLVGISDMTVSSWTPSGNAAWLANANLTVYTCRQEAPPSDLQHLDGILLPVLVVMADVHRRENHQLCWQ